MMHLVLETSISWPHFSSYGQHVKLLPFHIEPKLQVFVMDGPHHLELSCSLLEMLERLS